MSIKNHLLGLALVHQQAYERIFSALEAVPDGNYFEDKGLFFTSLHGTLNHCLLVDSLWYYRLMQQQPPFTVTGLDMQLQDNREGLKSALAEQANKLYSFVDNCDIQQLNNILTVNTSSGLVIHHPVSWLIATVVNHGTHHRGQITTILTQSGLPLPTLALTFYDNLHSLLHCRE